MASGSSSAIARSAARFFALFSLLMLAGCVVNRPNPSWGVVTPPTLGKDVVFYATDREPAKLSAKCKARETASTQPMYGSADSAEGRLLYGEFAVQLPGAKKIGALAPYRPRPQCLRTPSDMVFLTGPDQQERKDFFAAVRAAAEKSPKKEILVFVHGYNFEFDEAVLWTAQLGRYLEFSGPVVVYSWASRGRPLDYREDEAAVERSAPRLQQFLKDLRAEAGEARINVLAHSMGSRLLLGAIGPLSQEPPMFKNVILAAPDISTQEFVEQVERASRLAQRTTLYVCSLDRALFASQRLHKDFRAGRDLVLVKGVDTVDVSPVETSRTRHSYYVENRWVLNDVYQLLRDAAPGERFGLVERSAGEGKFWQLRP